MKNRMKPYLIGSALVASLLTSTVGLAQSKARKVQYAPIYGDTTSSNSIGERAFLLGLVRANGTGVSNQLEIGAKSHGQTLNPRGYHRMGGEINIGLSAMPNQGNTQNSNIEMMLSRKTLESRNGNAFYAGGGLQAGGVIQSNNLGTMQMLGRLEGGFLQVGRGRDGKIDELTRFSLAVGGGLVQVVVVEDGVQYGKAGWGLNGELAIEKSVTHKSDFTYGFKFSGCASKFGSSTSAEMCIAKNFEKVKGTVFVRVVSATVPYTAGNGELRSASLAQAGVRIQFRNNVLGRQVRD